MPTVATFGLGSQCMSVRWRALPSSCSSEHVTTACCAQQGLDGSGQVKSTVVNGQPQVLGGENKGVPASKIRPSESMSTPWRQNNMMREYEGNCDSEVAKHETARLERQNTTHRQLTIHDKPSRVEQS